MAYGFSINDRNGNSFAHKNTLNYFFLRKMQITITPMTNVNIPTDIPISCPVEMFYCVDKKTPDGAVCLDLFYETSNPTTWRILFYNYKYFTYTATVDIYFFVPIYVANWIGSGYGLETYSEEGELIFTTRRPLLDIKDIIISNNTIVNGVGVVGDTTTTSYKPAIPINYVGFYRLNNTEGRDLYYQAVGNEVYLEKSYYKRNGGSPIYSAPPTTLIKTIDANSYNGFSNLTWSQITTGI